jgi:hypothetical protein
VVKIGHSGLESALCKLPQEVKPHQEDEDIPDQVIEPAFWRRNSLQTIQTDQTTALPPPRKIGLFHMILRRERYI